MALSARTYPWASAMAACLLAAVLPPDASAAYFQFTEQSTVDLGRAHAGAGAAADDASIVWYNSAGLTQLPGEEITGGYSLQRWSVVFTKDSATDISGKPLSGGNGGQIGKPDGPFFLYYAKPLDGRFTFGIGVNEPFGFATHYDAGSIFRYQAIYDSLAIVNLNPALAYRVNGEFSLGLGLDAQRVYVKRTNALDFGALCLRQFSAAACNAQGLVPQAHDGLFSAQLDGSGYGFNLGALWDPGDDTRLGLSYRSRVKHTLDGNVSFSDVPPVLAAHPHLQAQGVSSSLTTPQIVSLSLWHRLDERWSLAADWTYTGWGSLDRFGLHFANAATRQITLKEGLAYSYRYSFGLDHRFSDAWTWRAGVSIDNSPVPDAKPSLGVPLNQQTNAVKGGRTARLPDDDRRWLAIGASWQASEHARWDFAYGHAFMNAHIPFDQLDAVSMDEISGQYDEHVDEFSLGYCYRF